MGRQRQQGWKGVCEISTFASQVSGNATRNTQQKTSPHRAQTGRCVGRRHRINLDFMCLSVSMANLLCRTDSMPAGILSRRELVWKLLVKERKIWLSCTNLCEAALDQLIRAQLCIFVIQKVLVNSMYYRLLFFTTNSALHHITSCEEFDGKKGYINKINYSHGRMGFWKWTEVEMDCATQGSHLALAI